MKKQMKPKYLLYMAGVVFALFGCSNDSLKQQLSLVDGLLEKKLNDSAMHVLQEINIDGIDDEDILAHYWLYKIQAGYRLHENIATTSPLDISIGYFQSHTNHLRLATAYYYKGNILYDQGNKKEGISYIKKAEAELPSNKKSDELRYYICSDLAYMNGVAKEHRAAIDYGRTALRMGYQLRDSINIAYDLQNISTAYSGLGLKDSARYFAEQLPAVMKNIPVKKQSDLYVSIGFACLYSSDTTQAKKYFQQALDIQENPYALKALAKIYRREGDSEQALSMLQKALQTEDLSLKANTLKEMHEIMTERGALKEALATAQHIDALKDSIARKRQEDDLKGTQQQMEFEAREHAMRQKNRRTAAIAAAAAVVLVATLLYYRRYRCRAQQQLHSAETDISRRNEEIESLRSINSRQQQQIERQQQELATSEERLKNADRQMEEMGRKWKSRQAMHEKRMAAGRPLYEHVEGGGTIISWEKGDLEHFVDYYRIVDHDFVTHLETAYRELSVRQMVFCILDRMKGSDEEVARIMGIGTGSVRQNRLRIREKHV